MKLIAYFIILLPTLFGHSAFARTQQTNICIKNTTSTSHLIRAGDVEDYHWDGDSRPDKNFNIVSISPGETICRREEVQLSAQPKFTMLIDGAPSEMAYLPTTYSPRVSHKTPASYGKYEWYNKDAKNNLYGEKTIWFQPNDMRLGYECSSGEKCRLFEIR